MSDPIDEADRSLHASLGQLTRGLSPASLMLAWADWAIHLGFQPTRALQMLALRPWMRAAALAAHTGHAPAQGCEHDHRLADPAWDAWPFRLYRDMYRAAAQWSDELALGVPGVERHHEQIVAFAARQLLGACSPANLPGLHPEVLRRTLATGGLNLLQGAQNWAEDVRRGLQHLPPAGAQDFTPGRQVAATPGKVVLRNGLMELIQYAPATPTVHAEPVLVMSAWIMKYYILDLSPHNSLIHYLVDQGHTVFAISWKNPGKRERDLGINDYLALGLMASLDAIGAIVPGRRVHAVGYCLGGTLLSIGAAAMARDHDERLATLTLLAAQTDFTDPGELGLFVDESQLRFLEDLMAREGYLESRQMAGAFQLLRPVDLIWTPMVRNYLLGERAPASDLMAWNADGTRMPYRMHADYLRSLFLDNELARGSYRVGGEPVSLRDIRAPVYAVGTATDHVAPWRSVHKLHLLCATDIRFVLTEGGHNAGIVSEPGHPRRRYRVLERSPTGPYVAPDRYLATAARHEGSWWPDLHAWLVRHSGPRRKPPPMARAALGLAPLCDAPGDYVMER